MSVLVPVVLFDLLSNAPLDTFSLLPLILFAAVQMVVFTIGCLLAHRVFGISAAEVEIL